jgi:uncharacterized protein (DUF1800 family)
MLKNRYLFGASLGVFVVLFAGCSGGGGSSSPGNVDTSASGNLVGAQSSAGTNPAQLIPQGVVASAPSAPPAPLGQSETSMVAGSAVKLSPDQAAPVVSNTAGGTVALTGPAQGTLQNAPPETPLSEKGAFRLLQQATFGATEAGMVEAKAKGPRRWMAEQFAMPMSTYGYRDRDAIHKWADKNTSFCDQFAIGTPERDGCYRDWYSSDLIKLEFFKHASLGTDQLRQRLAFALSQIIVTSEVEVNGLYGLADYQQKIRDASFTNYREILKLAATHPVMGEYLNMVNNDAADPNENFARELLQLFSIGTCLLNNDGTLKNGKCEATYNNEMVREYAFALTGWTFPAGGVNAWCTNNCGWKNPTYLKGSMLAVDSAHDKQARKLLNAVNLPAGHGAQKALDSVLDSLMNHPNIAPFIGKQLIQFFVSSNPSAAYVSRVASAFVAGKYETFGTGTKGDLQATIAAVLLDDEARNDTTFDSATAGKLREPIVMMVSAVRAFNGYTDGERMGKYGWGSSLSQPLFNSPSVFNFYAPDYPLPGNPGVVAPQFQLVNANTSMGWTNFTNDLIYWWYGKGQGVAAKPDLLGSTGTLLSYAAFEPDATDTTKLIDRLDRLLTGSKVGAVGRSAIAAALNTYTSADTWLADANNQSSWQRERVKTAAYLLISSPHFQVQR